jgi:hypothetical protein
MIRTVTEKSSYTPSPRQIHDECRKIRRKWSLEKRVSRRIGGYYAWRLLASPETAADGRRRFEFS